MSIDGHLGELTPVEREALALGWDRGATRQAVQRVRAARDHGILGMVTTRTLNIHEHILEQLRGTHPSLELALDEADRRFTRGSGADYASIVRSAEANPYLPEMLHGLFEMERLAQNEEFLEEHDERMLMWLRNMSVVWDLQVEGEPISLQDLEQLASYIIDRIKPEASGKRISLIVESYISEEQTAGGIDPSVVLIVLQNLIGNIDKHMGTSGSVVIKLYDHGIHIRTTNDLPEDSTSGTQQGLELLQELVLAHRGVIYTWSDGESSYQAEVFLPSTEAVSEWPRVRLAYKHSLWNKISSMIQLLELSREFSPAIAIEYEDHLGLPRGVIGESIEVFQEYERVLELQGVSHSDVIAWVDSLIQGQVSMEEDLEMRRFYIGAEVRQFDMSEPACVAGVVRLMSVLRELSTIPKIYDYRPIMPGADGSEFRHVRWMYNLDVFIDMQPDVVAVSGDDIDGLLADVCKTHGLVMVTPVNWLCDHAVAYDMTIVFALVLNLEENMRHYQAEKTKGTIGAVVGKDGILTIESSNIIHPERDERAARHDSGQGLALCVELAEAHGGELVVSEEHGVDGAGKPCKWYKTTAKIPNGIGSDRPGA